MTKISASSPATASVVDEKLFASVVGFIDEQTGILKVSSKVGLVTLLVDMDWLIGTHDIIAG